MQSPVLYLSSVGTLFGIRLRWVPRGPCSGAGCQSSLLVRSTLRCNNPCPQSELTICLFSICWVVTTVNARILEVAVLLSYQSCSIGSPCHRGSSSQVKNPLICSLLFMLGQCSSTNTTSSSHTTTPCTDFMSAHTSAECADLWHCIRRPHC